MTVQLIGPGRWGYIHTYTHTCIYLVRLVWHLQVSWAFDRFIIESDRPTQIVKLSQYKFSPFIRSERQT